ncbi:hypothetical protein J6590_077529 [Homalodisca vitripennis]|nr:hypothetical protein J6590_077529 [Homalodisca vitripennis]
MNVVTFQYTLGYPDISPVKSLNRHKAAKWLVDSGKVYGVGTDTASPDSKGIPIVHKTLTKENLYIMENLDMSHLKDVPPRGFKLAILPMRIEEGTGAPVHVILVTKEKTD